MAGEPELALSIHCRGLPGSSFESKSDVRLGIQRGAEVIDEVPGDCPAVTFRARVRVAGHPGVGRPDFLGPYAHGTADDRFVYLSWGGVEDGKRAMFRRAKIGLRDIGWDIVSRAFASGRGLEVTVNMTGKRGGPACATLESQGATWTLESEPA